MKFQVQWAAICLSLLAFGVPLEAADFSSIPKPCPDHAGPPLYFEGSGLCTGNLMTVITLPTTGITLFHNSLRPDYNFCVAPGWSLSLDRFMSDVTATGAIVTDGNGASVEFGKFGNLIKAIDPLLSQSSLQLSPKQEKTLTGLTMGYTNTSYNGRNFLSTVTNRAGQTTRIDRDSTTGCITSVTTPSGQVISFSVDTQNSIGRLRLIQSPAGNFNFNYDSTPFGNLASVVLPDGTQWQMAYVPSTPYLSSVINPLGETYSYQYIPGSGVLFSVADPSNRLQTVTYTPTSIQLKDENSQQIQSEEVFSGGKLTKVREEGKNIIISRESGGDARITQVSDGRGRVTKLSYAGTIAADRKNALPSSVTTPDGTVTTYTYNADLQTLSSTATNRGKTIATTWTWGNFGLLTSRTVNGLTTFLTRNSWGDLVSLTNESGRVEYQATYASPGLVSSATDSAGRTTNFSWNSDGTISQITDHLGRSLTYSNNALGLATSTTDNSGFVNNYFYDTMGNMTKMTRSYNGGPALTFQWDYTSYASGYPASYTSSTYFDGRLQSQDTTTYINGGNAFRNKQHLLRTGLSSSPYTLEDSSSGVYSRVHQSAPTPPLVGQ